VYVSRPLYGQFDKISKQEINNDLQFDKISKQEINNDLSNIYVSERRETGLIL